MLTLEMTLVSPSGVFGLKIDSAGIIDIVVLLWSQICRGFVGKRDFKAASENDTLVREIMIIYRKISSDLFIGIVHILHIYEKIEIIDFE